jgi:dihydroorotase
MRVTAEATPHHLVFNHEHVNSLDPAYKMYPPLRASSDVESLRGALIEGVIDAVATDHAPHSAYETEVTFEEAPRGVVGLETAAAAVNTAVGMRAEDFFDRMSIRPAEIAGFNRQGRSVREGGPANLIIFDPDSTWTPRSFASKSRNTPFLGYDLRGRVLATIFEGRITHDSRLAAFVR